MAGGVKAARGLGGVERGGGGAQRCCEASLLEALRASLFSGLFQLREAAWVLWLVALPPSSKHITPTSPNLTSPLADFDPPGVILEPFQ